MTGETSPRLSKRQRNLVLHPKKTIILLFLLSWLKFLLHDVDSIPWTTILFQYFLKNFSYFLYLSLLYHLFPLYIFRPLVVEVTFALHDLLWSEISALQAILQIKKATIQDCRFNSIHWFYTTLCTLLKTAVESSKRWRLRSTSIKSSIEAFALSVLRSFSHS